MRRKKMYRTPKQQPCTAVPARKGPAQKSKDERGMALVFALLGIVLLSVLAAALLVVTNAGAYASLKYKNQIQGSYVASAGVHRTVDWFRTTYSPWLNPTTGIPAYATAPPVTAGTYAGTPSNAPTIGGNPVVLGDSANFPTVASNNISSSFDSMRTSLNTITLGNTTGEFTIRDASLMSHDRYKAFDGMTDRIVERWRLRVTGTVRNAAGTLAVVEETAVLQTAPIPIWSNALQGRCTVEMNGALTTDSFDSRNGVYGGSNLFTGGDADASVTSNSFAGASGVSAVINGDLHYGAVPDSAGGCTDSGENVTDSIVQGNIEEYPPLPYPLITPTFTTGSASQNDCKEFSVAYDASTTPKSYRYTPNAPNGNEWTDCSLTGGNDLELRVPTVDESSGAAPPVRFFVREITVTAGTSSVIRVHDTATPSFTPGGSETTTAETARPTWRLEREDKFKEQRRWDPRGAVGAPSTTQLVSLRVDHLGHAFVGIHTDRGGTGVEELQHQVAGPLRLQRGGVHNEATAGIGALPMAQTQHKEQRRGDPRGKDGPSSKKQDMQKKEQRRGGA